MSDLIRHTPFDIKSLRSEELTRLFLEVNSYTCRCGIEEVSCKESHLRGEVHPALTIGLTQRYPIIRFASLLDRKQRIEAIGHEFMHLLLIYRFGLGVIGRRIPRYGSSEDVFNYYMSMKGDWVFLLGQVTNTAHHLILVDYLERQYGIESPLHLRLLHQNFCVIAKEGSRDEESIRARGLIAFEYEKLVGKFDTIIHPPRETESFWTAYHKARECFGRYSFHTIPTSSLYQENILSFLESLGYPKKNFTFHHGRVYDPCYTG